MKHSGSFFLKFWFCKKFVQHRSHTENDLKDKPQIPVGAAVLMGVTSSPLVCFALEMSVTDVLLVPQKWCHDGAWACVSTGLAHRAQILGEVQWCCRPGMGMGMGSRSLQPPRACASLPSHKHQRGGSSSGWDGNNSPTWEVRAARQQLLFHLQQLGGWSHLHLLRPELCARCKCLLLI